MLPFHILKVFLNIPRLQTNAFEWLLYDRYYAIYLLTLLIRDIIPSGVFVCLYMMHIFTECSGCLKALSTEYVSTYVIGISTVTIKRKMHIHVYEITCSVLKHLSDFWSILIKDLGAKLQSYFLVSMLNLCYFLLINFKSIILYFILTQTINYV